MSLNPQDFEKIEKIGRGSFGEVYKGRNKRTGQTVAIKIIDLEETQDEIEDIQREIHVLKQCNSLYVVSIYGSFVCNTKLWIIIEYLAGGSLLDIINIMKAMNSNAALLEQGSSPSSSSVSASLSTGNSSPSNNSTIIDEKYIAIIMREMLMGLDYLHSQGLIHRDIKAANVLLDQNGAVKIADFGVCGQLSTTINKRHSFVGTPYWMAPEVIKQSGYNEKADIWSLGITGIEMAKGSPPYHGDDPMKILFLIPKNDPPTLEGNFSKAFKEFISLCLKRDPNQRPTAKELLKHKFIKSAKKSIALLQDLVDLKAMYEANVPQSLEQMNNTDTIDSSSSNDEETNTDEAEDLLDDDEVSSWNYDLNSNISRHDTNRSGAYRNRTTSNEAGRMQSESKDNHLRQSPELDYNNEDFHVLNQTPSINKKEEENHGNHAETGDSDVDSEEATKEIYQTQKLVVNISKSNAILKQNIFSEPAEDELGSFSSPGPFSPSHPHSIPNSPSSVSLSFTDYHENKILDLASRDMLENALLECVVRQQQDGDNASQHITQIVEQIKSLFHEAETYRPGFTDQFIQKMIRLSYLDDIYQQKARNYPQDNVITSLVTRNVIQRRSVSLSAVAMNNSLNDNSSNETEQQQQQLQQQQQQETAEVQRREEETDVKNKVAECLLKRWRKKCQDAYDEFNL